jgi:F0F1-type ATP synthase beta subunit
MDDGKIDLVRYGVLWQKVENYEQKFDAMERKIDAMETDLKKLVLMAERSKGSLWALMGVAGVFGSAISFLADFLFIKK